MSDAIRVRVVPDPHSAADWVRCNPYGEPLGGDCPDYWRVIHNVKHHRLCFARVTGAVLVVCQR
jgi:hypothetical protein